MVAENPIQACRWWEDRLKRHGHEPCGLLVEMETPAGLEPGISCSQVRVLGALLPPTAARQARARPESSDSIIGDMSG